MQISKFFLSFVLAFCLFMCTACADRTIYLPKPSPADNWQYITGFLIALISLIHIYTLLQLYNNTNNKGQELVLNSAINNTVHILLGVLVFPFLIFGEWFFELFMWSFSQGVAAKIILIIIGLILGIRIGIYQSITLWLINVFFWHISPLYFFISCHLLWVVLSTLPILGLRYEVLDK